MMTKKTDDKKTKVINVKLDDEMKSKFETLAYLKDMTLQDLCKDLIAESIKKNKKAIDEAEKIRAKFK